MHVNREGRNGGAAGDGTSSATFESRTHQRQFLIGAQPVLYRSDWRVVRLSDTAVLSHCPDLPVQTAVDASGATWVLIGTAIHTTRRSVTPVEEIREHHSSEIPQLYADWAGRWILIGEGQVHLDATAMLSCYYARNRSGCSRDLPWVSSSPALLAEVLDSAAGTEDPRELVYAGKYLTWFPLPGSRFSNIGHLLPSQVLCLDTGALRARPLLPDLETTRSYEEMLERLESAFVIFFHNLMKQFPTTPRWLSLTGGGDSRVILAAARKGGASLGTFTFAQSHNSIGDDLMPERVARAAGCKHIWLRPGVFIPEKAELYDRHTARSIASTSRPRFAQGQMDFGRTGDIIMRGLCFEICLPDYFDWMPPEELSPPDLAAAWGVKDEYSIALLTEWNDWVKKTPIEGMDWRTRFYIEQRMAGWFSAIELSVDITKYLHLNPGNAARTIALMLALPWPKRQGRRQYQSDLIRSMCPELERLPINPEWDQFSLLSKLQWRWRKDHWFPVRKLIQRVRRGRKA